MHKQFTFDFAYGFESQQKDIYEDCAYNIVESVFQGYNGTIFAYGQTGTGKTFTMEGGQDENQWGITPRTFSHIFEMIHSSDKSQFLVSCSMLELYNEQVYDLLQGTDEKLEVHEKPEDGFYVKNLSIVDRSSAKECIELLNITDATGNVQIRKGKLNLVDLAGSERQKKTNVIGSQMKEAQKINFSLVCLGKVISALVKSGNNFIPYRDSKLTKLLMNSLGGNSKTVMIANIGPAELNYDESLCTLRYANQAKNIKNKPIINEDPKDTKLRHLQDEIEKLKQYLRNAQGVNTINIDQGVSDLFTSQMLQNLSREREQFEEKFKQETEKIMQMKKITEQERKRLIEELKKNEQIQKNKVEEKQKLLNQIAEFQKKVIQGD